MTVTNPFFSIYCNIDAPSEELCQLKYLTSKSGEVAYLYH